MNDKTILMFDIVFLFLGGVMLGASNSGFQCFLASGFSLVKAYQIINKLYAEPKAKKKN